MKKYNYLVTTDDTNIEEFYSYLYEAKKVAADYSKQYGRACIWRWDLKEDCINDDFQLEYSQGKTICRGEVVK